MLKITYHYSVFKEDIPRVTSSWRKKIKKAIEDRLTKDPRLYGKPLRRSLRGCYKLRIGDYRVIFKIKKNVVKVFIIGHRSLIYKQVQKRI